MQTTVVTDHDELAAVLDELDVDIHHVRAPRWVEPCGICPEADEDATGKVADSVAAVCHQIPQARQVRGYIYRTRTCVEHLPGEVAYEVARRTVHGTVMCPESTVWVEVPALRSCGLECTGAASTERCDCECGGVNHGILHLPPERRPGYRPSTRSPFAGMPVVDDEAF